MTARKSAGNITVTYNSNNVTAYVNQAQLNSTAAELEATTLTSTGQQFDPGLSEWSLDLTTDWEKAMDDIFGPDAITPTKRTVVITVTGSGGTVTYTWTTNGFVTGYNIGAQATGKLTSAPKLRLSGIPTRS
jgi:hypothetical protein